MIDTTITPQAIPPQIFQRIQNNILGDSFPWFYLPGVAYDPTLNTQAHRHEHGFMHLVTNEGKSNSVIAELFETVIVSAISQIHPGKNIYIHRLRLGLLLGADSPIVHAPHVDCDDAEHRTALFYFNDSDGDTILYNEMYDPTSGLQSYNYYRNVLNSQVTENQRIQPRANTMLTFRGNRYHSSSAPVQTARRVAANANYYIRD
jgi:hypothetical protein